MKNAKRNRRQRVSPEPRLVRRAVESDETRVDRGLIERVEARESGRDFRRDPLQRVLHVKAAEALSAVAFVDRFTGAARGACRRNAAPYRTVAQDDFRFDRRAAARVPDAPRDKRLDDRLAHDTFRLEVRTEKA